MANVPSRVLKLVQTFDCNIEAYKKQPYNETQVRREFIDPFFEALGWDVTNKAGLAQAYKDVIHEDAIKVGGATEAPDYCFRIGGVRKFFVEAKKPSVDIKHDVHPAYKLRRYGWSAKLPLSILTDFEEFAVYDCQTRPKQADKASGARIMYYTYKDYTKKWDEIANIFSKDAILKGSFDKFVASTKAKRGTTTVDKEFLAELEKWRAELAKIIALRNRELSARDINFAVQRTIDRIIFLRMAEDRGIEPYGQLRAISSGSRTYPRLCEVFEKADHKYNSGLFYFQKESGRPESPDLLTLNIVVDDSPLSYMLHSLYYPLCPYEFSVLPVEILGNVYEQFLGSVIQVSSGRRTKVEPKPAVKKAGGIYYTPSYIVNYIVKNTVGQLVENKTPKDISKLRILDPACGSGSFLISAYQYLLDWHIKYYSENGPEEHAKGKSPKLYQVTDDNWKLTTHERKRILLNNIFGVDIDSQAIEVTKLSLLLKVLEGESQLTLENQMRFFHERALPDLGNNIKCGNSLIGPDFYEDKDLDSFDDEQRRKINPFDYKTEFPNIFKTKNPGFDAVIGNPPWGGDIDNITEYLEKKYPRSTKGYKDTSKLFMDKGINLTRKNGFFSFIVPSAFMLQPRYLDIRRLVRKFCIAKLWNVGDKVFSSKVAAPCCVFVLEKSFPKNTSLVSVLDTVSLRENFARAKFSESPIYREIPQSIYEKTTQETFVTYHRELRGNEVRLEKVLDCKDCGIKHQRVGVGMEQKGKTDLANRLYYEGPQQSTSDRKYLIGSDLSSSGWYIDHSVYRYFRGNYKTILRKNEIVYFNESVFNLSEKIVWRQTSDRIRATIIGPCWFANTLQAGILPVQKYDIRYVLGLLNSKFLNFLYVESVKESGRVFPQVKLAKVRSLPIRTIDFDNPDDKARHDKMVKLVDQMLGLHKKLAKAKVPAEKTRIQRQINTTDSAIDKLVYQLYNLTEEEIAIIEGKT